MGKTKGAKHRTKAQQIADAELRLNRLKKDARKEETRKKILVGSMMLSLAESDDKIANFLKQKLDERLAPRNRQLFAESMGITIPGLYGKKLQPADEHQAGWSVWCCAKATRPLRPLDRYGSVIE